MNAFSCMFNLAKLKYNDHILHFILQIIKLPNSSLVTWHEYVLYWHVLTCILTGQPLGWHPEHWRMGCRKLIMHSFHFILFYVIEKIMFFFSPKITQVQLLLKIFSGVFLIASQLSVHSCEMQISIFNKFMSLKSIYTYDAAALLWACQVWNCFCHYLFQNFLFL